MYTLKNIHLHLILNCFLIQDKISSTEIALVFNAAMIK